MIKGVSQNEEIITNTAGGKQAKGYYSFNLIDESFLFALAERLKFGADKGYEKDNWRKIPWEDHMDHCLTHLLAWKSGDKSDDHLAGFITRCMMMYATAKESEKDIKDYPAYKTCENCKNIELPWMIEPCKSCFNEKNWEVK